MGSVRPLTLLNLVLPQGFCTCCSLCLKTSSPDTCVVPSLPHFSFQLMSTQWPLQSTTCSQSTSPLHSHLLTMYILLIYLFNVCPTHHNGSSLNMGIFVYFSLSAQHLAWGVVHRRCSLNIS